MTKYDGTMAYAQNKRQQVMVMMIVMIVMMMMIMMMMIVMIMMIIGPPHHPGAHSALQDVPAQAPGARGDT